MARRRPDSTAIGPWFRMGTDILTDVRLLRLDKADRWRYTELIALAKRSVNHTTSNEEIGDLLAGFGEPMLLEDIARELRESPARVRSFLGRLEQHMPGAVVMREGRFHLAKFAKRQYDFPSDMPHRNSADGPTMAPPMTPTQAGQKPANGPGQEEDEDGEGEGVTTKANADARVGCPFCRKPTHGPLQHYHDRARDVLGRCLVIDPRKCGPLIAKREALLGRERCHALFEVYLASEDQFVLKQGHSLSLFCSDSMQNGLAAALDAGLAHGARGGPVKASLASSASPASPATAKSVAESWRV